MRFRNVDRLKRKLKAMPKVAKDEIKAALDQSAVEINTLQRSFVPEDDGVLKSTIGSAPLSESTGRLGVEVFAGGPATTKPVRKGGPAYDYAFAQEFGTKKMSANPFFFPAYRLVKRRVKGRISRAINRAAKKVAGA